MSGAEHHNRKEMGSMDMGIEGACGDYKDMSLVVVQSTTVGAVTVRMEEEEET